MADTWHSLFLLRGWSDFFWMWSWSTMDCIKFSTKFSSMLPTIKFVTQKKKKNELYPNRHQDNEDNEISVVYNNGRGIPVVHT
ncbi:hypothetical protein DERP_012384 [Dermatophagoides pteronyssinus]|uniref:Uncharacterized protein n=1 Tax=Dermatophagoides pteronyssinus TaxID=6956 RepID=A0ABQ8IUK4_DERPT|nr:hypothetical protein DERP_012384 [Dermatophagoides pteronyssinus]